MQVSSKEIPYKANPQGKCPSCMGGTMNMSRVNRSICVSLLFLSLFACSSPSFPYGTFVSDSGSDQMVLNADGSFTYSESGTVVTTGTFSIQGNELTWETDSYCDERGAGKATYTWTFEDDTLVLQLKGEDHCSDRRYVLNLAPYHLEQ